MEAARIVTGCSKLVSLLDLTREAGCESLSERRHKHKLLLYFKMVNGLCPSTLSVLVPQSNNILRAFVGLRMIESQLAEQSLIKDRFFLQ